MKSKLLGLFLVLMLGFTSVAMAADNVNNKFCPVTGEEIKADEPGGPGTVEYKGKVYNLCCKMCVKDFNKDPEKYIKKMEEKEPATATGASAAQGH